MQRNRHDTKGEGHSDTRSEKSLKKVRWWVPREPRRRGTTRTPGCGPHILERTALSAAALYASAWAETILQATDSLLTLGICSELSEC